MFCFLGDWGAIPVNGHHWTRCACGGLRGPWRAWSGRARQRRLPGSRLRLGVRLRRRKQSQLELFNINFGPLTVALVVVLAEILISLTLCSSKCSPHSPAHAALLLLLSVDTCCSVVSKQKMPKKPGKTRKYPGVFRYFRGITRTLDAGVWTVLSGDRRGSLPLSVIGLPYIVVQPA